jgi:DMSO/TMAO reductase YedYZ heme-binding membrane subunit
MHGIAYISIVRTAELSDEQLTFQSLLYSVSGILSMLAWVLSFPLQP